MIEAPSEADEKQAQQSIRFVDSEAEEAIAHFSRTSGISVPSSGDTVALTSFRYSTSDDDDVEIDIKSDFEEPAEYTVNDVNYLYSQATREINGSEESRLVSIVVVSVTKDEEE